MLVATALAAVLTAASPTLAFADEAATGESAPAATVAPVATIPALQETPASSNLTQPSNSQLAQPATQPAPPQAPAVGNTALATTTTTSEPSIAPASLPPNTITVTPAAAVSYIDAGGNTQTCNNPNLLTLTSYSQSVPHDSRVFIYGGAGQTTWWTVRGNVDLTSRHYIYFVGNVHLILEDNSYLKSCPIIVESSGGGGLTVYAQSTQANKGRFEAIAHGDKAFAFGTYPNSSLTINGGSVHFTRDETVSDNASTIGYTEQPTGILTMNGGELFVDTSKSDKGTIRMASLNINGGSLYVKQDKQDCPAVNVANVSITGGSVIAVAPERAPGVFPDNFFEGSVNYSDGSLTLIATKVNGDGSPAAGSGANVSLSPETNTYSANLTDVQVKKPLSYGILTNGQGAQYEASTSMDTMTVKDDTPVSLPTNKPVTLKSGDKTYTLTSDTGTTLQPVAAGGKLSLPAGAKLEDESGNVSIIQPGATLDSGSTGLSNPCTVTFDTRGGDALAAQTVNYGELLSAAAPTRTDCTFAGWYKDAACTSTFDVASDVIAQSITLYAKWTCTVTFDSLGGSAVAAQTINPLDAAARVATPAAPTKAGRIFGGWYTSADCTGASFNFSQAITNNTTLYAKWSGLVSDVTAVANNALSATLSDAGHTLANKVLASADKQTYLNNVDVSFELVSKDQTPSDADALLIASKLNDYTKATDIDLTFFQTLGSTRTQLSQSTSPVSVRLILPTLPALKTGYTRSYVIVRSHGGVADTLPVTVNSDGTITFATDKFSAYALAYKDTAPAASNPGASSGNTSGGNNGSGSNADTGSTSSGSNANTGNTGSGNNANTGNTGSGTNANAGNTGSGNTGSGSNANAGNNGSGSNASSNNATDAATSAANNTATGDNASGSNTNVTGTGTSSAPATGDTAPATPFAAATALALAALLASATLRRNSCRN